MHKTYAEDPERVAAYDALVAEYRAPSQERAMGVVATPVPAPLPPAELDLAAFHAAWDGMTDTHEFFPLIMRHGITRRQALRLAGESRARKVGNQALNAVLERSAASQLPIMIFVGNPGVLQVRSGKVENVKRLGPWLNVMDPDFNLHLREDHIAESWTVVKPTAAGAVSSLELFAADGTTIAMLFVKRDDREKAENPVWAEVLSGLPEIGTTA